MHRLLFSENWWKSKVINKKYYEKKLYEIKRLLWEVHHYTQQSRRNIEVLGRY